MRRIVSSLFLFAALFAASLSTAAAAGQGKLMRFADVHGDKIVFTYEGDLWLVSTEGGTACRITRGEGSEVFAKFSALTSLVDLEFMAGYAWDDDPTMHVVKSIDPETHELTGLTVYPEHHRLTIGGGSFSTTLGPFVLRGEGAYYKGKYFNSTDPTLPESVVKKDYLHYLVGMDYTLWDIHLSGQFIQQAILQYEETIDRDEYENMGTFLASRDFLDETLNLQLFVYYGFNNSDALIRPRVTYDLADGFEILLGANIFTGTEGWFGQYNDNDMVYTKVKYSF